MKKWLINWLLRRLGYPTHRLVQGAPSMLAVVQDNKVVYTTTQSFWVARSKCREIWAKGGTAKVVLYRAVREEAF